MKSSKDVPPRVGMQFSWCCEFPWGERHGKIGRIDETGVILNGAGKRVLFAAGTGGAWDAGEVDIEWTPPTDEERRMLKRAADHVRTGKGECQEYCEWEYWFETGATIADSLALDGADCDNMPAGYR